MFRTSDGKRSINTDASKCEYPMLNAREQILKHKTKAIGIGNVVRDRAESKNADKDITPNAQW